MATVGAFDAKKYNWTESFSTVGVGEQRSEIPVGCV